MTLSDVGWSPTTLDVVIRLEDPSLLFVKVNNLYNWHCKVITVINSGGISSDQMKVDIAVPSQMAEQGSVWLQASWTLWWTAKETSHKLKYCDNIYVYIIAIQTITNKPIAVIMNRTDHRWTFATLEIFNKLTRIGRVSSCINISF